jgi:predicted peptidase
MMSLFILANPYRSIVRVIVFVSGVFTMARSSPLHAQSIEQSNNKLHTFETKQSHEHRQPTETHPVQSPVTKYPAFQRDMRTDGNDTLPYRWLAPLSVAPSQKYPLVIALHGSGERGSDNERQLTWFAPILGQDTFRMQYPSYVIVPQCPKNKRWAEVDWSLRAHILPTAPSAPMRLLFELIDEMIKTYPIDPRRVYITGLSMGGFGTFDALARKPALFSAGMPVCGGADTATAHTVRHIPLWIFHGALDKVVIPERSRDMVLALRRAGALPQYTEYPDVEHGSWKPTYANPDVWRWLFAQRRY